jgi:hypothetical protein
MRSNTCGADCHFIQLPVLVLADNLPAESRVDPVGVLNHSRKEKEMTKLAYSCLALVFVLTVSSIVTIAQVDKASAAQIDRDIELLRKDLRTEKKGLIALNLPLTETEATKFWPVYDGYALAMKKSYDQFYAIIKDYAANQKTLTDAQALELLKRWSAEAVMQAKTRQEWIPKFEKVLPGRKAAHFFQIDRRLYALLDLQLASEIPLVTP